MNDPIIEPPIESSATDCCSDVEQYVRRNPTSTILIAAAIGLGIAVLARALRPEPTPRDRAARLLEDLEERIRDAVSPVFRQASSLASNGAGAVQHGVHSGEAKVERLIRDTRKQIRKFLS